MRTPVLLLSLLLLLLASAKLNAQTCQAAFSFGETSLTVDFTDGSTSDPGDPITSWLWDFEDGTTSNLQSPTHTFPTVDKYEVCLTITTQSGCTSQLCARIDICVLEVSVSLDSCTAGNGIPLVITVNDLLNTAEDVDISIDGVLLPGSPFLITTAQPVTVLDTISGDGLSHTITVQSGEVGTCNTSYTFQAPDCASDCFLSGLSVTVANGVTHTVQVGDNFFSPQNLTITVGDGVEFQWVGDGHSTTSDATTGPDSWNSGVIGFGSVYTVNISNPGAHRYYCIPHGGPNGQGMSGMIVANCPPSGQFSYQISFNTTVDGPAGYRIILDGVEVSGSPFAYNGAGPQSNMLSIAGDGALHSIEIQDIADPTCILSRTFSAPDCGVAPGCSISVAASLAGGCSPTSQVPVELSVNAVNGGASGFDVYVDGNLVSGGPFAYNPAAAAVVTVDVPGDGLSHTLEVRDIDTPGCNSSAAIITPDCSMPCLISNLSLSTGNSIVHTVLVEDFAFNPKHLTITSGDIVQWEWVGSVAHTSTSDFTSGPDSWNSGLLGQGATYQSPVLSAGVHPYYCIPHGAPGGVGMSGTVTVKANCTGGMVAVAVSFTEQSGGFNGFEVLVDGTLAGSFAYDATGNNTISVLVPGDGQSHAILVRDADNPDCVNEATLITPDCNASTCQLGLSAQEVGGCNASNEVPVQLTITDTGGGISGFEVLLDGLVAGSYTYSGSGTTAVNVNVAGDGQMHNLEVRDIEDTTCTAATSLTTANCALGCSINGLELATAASGSPITHLVEVRDFEFVPALLEAAVGDIVRFEWTGVIAHTSTSDATAGPDSWNSGLLGQGGLFEVVITTEGEHPYYCIPHGGPGGVGMAGMIIASPPCNSGNVAVNVSFNAVGGSPGGFNLVADGEPLPGNPFAYSPTGSNAVTVNLPGDGQQHILLVQDSGDSGCNAGQSILLPDCGQRPPCSISLGATIASDCNEANEITAQLTVMAEGAGGNGFLVLIDGNLVQTLPFAYDPSGTTTLDIPITGTGEERLIEVQDVDSTSCSAAFAINTPLCGPVCEIQDLTVGSGRPGKHLVEVLDFEFSPAYLETVVGDTIEFVWKGAIAHTSTSDATSGPNSWNSGLLGFGGRYQVVISEAGLHPYYCIPHGGPGGIGMSGVIDAVEPCDNGNALVVVAFSTTNGSNNGYNLFLDGEYLAGPIAYNNEVGYNSTLAAIPGDSAQHVITVQDVDVSYCAASTTFNAPKCEVLCEIANLAAVTGPEVIHTVHVEDFQFNPKEIDVRVGERVHFVWTGQIPHTTTSDAITGPDSWNSGLMGQGGSYELIITNPGLHPYYCIPHGGPGGIGMSGLIRAAPACENDSVTIAVSFDISSGSNMGFNLFVDGQEAPDSPFGYGQPTGYNQEFITIPGDGAIHLITVQDLETEFCAATAQVVVPDCSAGCAINGLSVSFPVSGRHLIEVLDFAFEPRELTVTAGDTVEFFWTGAIPHTTTSDATSGIDTWDSGLLGQGANFEVVIHDPGLHPFYCIPHGAPGGVGMAGLITALPACEGDSVLASIAFPAMGEGSAFQLLLDGEEIGRYPYQPGGANNLEVLLYGDGQIHEISVRDENDPNCGDTLSIEVPLCTEPCLLQGTVIQAGACDDNMEVPFELTISAHNAESEGFQILIDGAVYPGGPFPYNPNGLTVAAISLPGDGAVHQLRVEEAGNPDCSLSFELILPNCLEPCAGLIPAFRTEVGGQGNLLVQFTDQTAGTVHQWLWGFGDGATSNVQNPFHTYDQPGTYTVCLLVQDTLLGCNQVSCQQLQVGVTGTKEVRNKILPLAIFPNPAGKNSRQWKVAGIVSSDYSSLIHYVAYDTRGERVAEGWARGKEIMEIPLDAPLPTGVYIIELHAPTRSYAGKIVVQ